MVRIHDELQPSVAIQTWMSDVTQAYQDLKGLCSGANSGKCPSEELLVAGLRGHAPTRHRDAAHWSSTKKATTLETFFTPMLEWGQGSTYNTGSSAFSWTQRLLGLPRRQ